MSQWDQYADAPPAPAATPVADYSQYAEVAPNKWDEYTDKPTPTIVHPAEVAVNPDNPDLKAFANAVGIDYDTASKSDLFDKEGMIQQYKDKNPGVANNISRSLGAASPVASDSITNFTEGTLHTLGKWADAATHKAQDWMDTPENSAADNAARKLQEAVNANINERIVNKGVNLNASGSYNQPMSTTTGNVVGNVVPAMAGGEAVAAALPEVTGIGAVSTVGRIARGSTIGAGSGAVAEPENMVHGAKVGAITGGVVSTAAEGVGATIRAVSKNTPAEMRDIANTSDALLGEGGPGLKGAGTAEVLGRPNLTGERSISNLANVDIPAWIPFGNKVKQFGTWLSGSGSSQGQKLMGTETANLQATMDADAAVSKGPGGNWLETLRQDPALQSQQAKLDMHDPEKFAQYFPKLTPEGQKAAVAGMLENARNESMLVGRGGNGFMDLPTFNDHLKQMIGTTGGDFSYINGYNKWTLQGLQKLTEMSINPSVTRAQLVKAAEGLGGKSPVQAAVGIATGLVDDVAAGGSHVLGHVLQAPVIYNLANRALDSKVVRDAVIDLAEAKTPTQTIIALSAISAASNKNQ